jgi:hypothetical protein
VDLPLNLVPAPILDGIHTELDKLQALLVSGWHMPRKIALGSTVVWWQDLWATLAVVKLCLQLVL